MVTDEEKRRAREAQWRLTGTGCDHENVKILGAGAEADLMQPPYCCEGGEGHHCVARPVVQCVDCSALSCAQHAGKRCPAPRCIIRLLPKPFEHKGHIYG